MNDSSRFFLSLILAATFVFGACQRVPITGRRQATLLPKESLNDISSREYANFMKASTICMDAEKVLQVQRVGKRLSAPIAHYFELKKQPKTLQDYQWEFNLVESPQMNAWCLPGGKVVVYTGLLPVTLNDDGLAAVIGHEMGHAIGNHGNERLSNELGVKTGKSALSKLLQSYSRETQVQFLKSYDLGANIGAVKPYEKLHESEADLLGMIFMAMAGYDPEEAIKFWQRKEKISEVRTEPQFLNTHPSYDKRIADLKENMPKAKEYAEKYGLK